MTTRAQFLAAVEGMVGTPFVHRGRLPGVALDCVGVVMAALLQCGLEVPEPAPYGNLPGGLCDGLSTIALPVPHDLREPGDLLTFVIGGEPRHVGVLVARQLDRDWIVHAKSNLGRVVRQPLQRSLMLHGCWRLREAYAWAR